MTTVSWSFVFADQIHLTYDDYEFQLSSISFSNGDFRAYAYNPFGLVTSVSSSSGTTLKLQTCHTTTSLTDDPNHCFKVLSNGLVKQKLQVHQSGKVSSTQSTSGKYLPICNCTQIGKVGNTDNTPTTNIWIFPFLFQNAFHPLKRAEANGQWPECRVLISDYVLRLLIQLWWANPVAAPARLLLRLQPTAILPKVEEVTSKASPNGFRFRKHQCPTCGLGRRLRLLPTLMDDFQNNYRQVYFY